MTGLAKQLRLKQVLAHFKQEEQHFLMLSDSHLDDGCLVALHVPVGYSKELSIFSM